MDEWINEWMDRLMENETILKNGQTDVSFTLKHS